MNILSFQGKEYWVKDCPCCGERPQFMSDGGARNFTVFCINCNLKLVFYGFVLDSTASYVVSEWNKRTSDVGKSALAESLCQLAAIYSSNKEPFDSPKWNALFEKLQASFL
jgi:hypothetical protein